jgi:hypothetical protein
MRLRGVLALAISTAVIAAACNSNSPVNQADSPPAVTPGTDTPYLWVSATKIPPSGGDLAVAVVNPTNTTLSWPGNGSLDRWNGQRWVTTATWTGSLDQWGGFGGLTHDSGGANTLLLLTADAHHVGAVQYLDMPSLKPGWYRLGVEGKAFAVLQVALGTTAPTLTNPPNLTVSPELLPISGGEVGLDGFPPNTGVVTYDQVKLFNEQLSPSVILQKLHGTAWVEIATLQAKEPPPSYIEHPAGVGVMIPPLGPGAYRLVRHSPTEGDLARQFWAIQPPASVALFSGP